MRYAASSYALDEIEPVNRQPDPGRAAAEGTTYQHLDRVKNLLRRSRMPRGGIEYLT